MKKAEAPRRRADGVQFSQQLLRRGGPNWGETRLFVEESGDKPRLDINQEMRVESFSCNKILL